MDRPTSPGTATTAVTSTGPLSPGQQFGTRYRILKSLGAGGMGVVYQAWDEELDLPVALKVIRPEALAEPMVAEELSRRFKRELVLARQVTHRNVVRIHDLGEINGIKYISMPFIEGQPLSAVLVERGRLPLPDALRLTKQVAEGLQAAHEAGVIHRDLKPENVMIDREGHPVIMDFGISRSASAATTVGLTTSGEIIGTIEYMSPEQALGEPVDQRADLYSLGLITYDMLAGRQRLASVTTPVTEMMQRLQHPPAPLRSKVPDVPADIETLVTKALDPDPSKRYQNAAQLIADIDRIEHGAHVRAEGVARRRRLVAFGAGGALAVILFVAAVGWWASHRTAPAAAVAHEPMSVLIADFDNRAQEPLFEGALEQALGIGIEEASFIGAVSRADALKAVQQFAPGQRLDLDRARLYAQREGIKLVLAGQINRVPSGYHVMVRAIDPVPGKEILRFEGDGKGKGDVLGTIASIAGDLRRQLGDVSTESTALSARETFTAASLEAASEYSRAQALANSSKDEEAIAHYQRAVQLDPAFGRAYSGWALSAGKLGRTQESAELWKKVLTLLDRMSEREKYRTLGNYYREVGNDGKSLENWETLAHKYPADGAAHNNLAMAYFDKLDFDKAQVEGKQLVQLYPRSVLYRYNHALYAMYAGDFATAEKEARAALSVNPETPKAYFALAIVAAARGDIAAARAAYEEAARKAGVRGLSLSRAGLADLAVYEARYAEGIALLKQGITEDRTNKNSLGVGTKSAALAEAFLVVGDKKGAIAAARDGAGASLRDGSLVGGARMLVAAGEFSDADPFIDRLGNELRARSRAYAAMLQGETALAHGRHIDAIELLQNASKLADLWIIRFDLGRAYLEAGHAAEALAEFETCAKRQAEASAVFLDDVPTYRYLAVVPYWLGRAQEAIGSRASAAENYRKYLQIRPPASDPLAADAERRAKALR